MDDRLIVGLDLPDAAPCKHLAALSALGWL